MQALEPFQDNNAGTVFRPVVMLLPHLARPGARADNPQTPPGNVLVEIRWPDGSDADVDLWVQAPGDVPVGYSNRGGRVFDLLRDDLDRQGDATELNFESAYARGAPAGEYTVNIHLYRPPSDAHPVPVTVAVGVRPAHAPATSRIAVREVLLKHGGQELTVAVEDGAQDRNLATGSAQWLRLSQPPERPDPHVRHGSTVMSAPTMDSSAERPAARARKATGHDAATRTVNLALQGGGAHGAFAWGVLDRLLEDERIAFEGVSATSAGAMNAAVLAYGLAEGGREGARSALTSFWRRISHAASLGPLQPSVVDRVLHNHALDHSPAFVMLDFMSRLLSPYQLNPANYNPLQRLLDQAVDFARLRELAPVKLFLSATNVRTGKVKIFTNKEITSDAVMASACLPFMFQAVEIDGEAYWDGGYMGNPAIYPLIYHCESPDVLVVHINPLERPEIPRSATEIMNRINEISFNSSLMREMRAIAFVTRLIDTGAICGGSLKRMNIHAISADSVMQKLSVMSKLNADWEFLTHLRDDGREFADRWLAENFGRIGVESTIDVHARYL